MARKYTISFDSAQLGSSTFPSSVEECFTPTWAVSGLINSGETHRTSSYAWESRGAQYMSPPPAVQLPVISTWNRGYQRAAVYIYGFSDAKVQGMGFAPSNGGADVVYWDSNGFLNLDTGPAQTFRMTGTYKCAKNTWYVLELQSYHAGASSIVEYKLYDISGTILLETGTDTTNLTTSTLQYAYLFGGWWNTGSNPSLRWDSWAVNDDTGGSENSYPNPRGRIALLLPISDSKRMNWTTGAGGTTNLWDAVNKTPPLGALAASETATSNIKSTYSGIVQDYDTNIAAYTTAPIYSTDTILLVQPMARFGNHGSDVTISGGVQILNNPVGSMSTLYALPGVTHSGEINNWHTVFGDPIYSPSISGTQYSPIVRARAAYTSASAGNLCCDFIGLLTEYINPDLDLTMIPNNRFDRPDESPLASGWINSQAGSKGMRIVDQSIQAQAADTGGSTYTNVTYSGQVQVAIRNYTLDSDNNNWQMRLKTKYDDVNPNAIGYFLEHKWWTPGWALQFFREGGGTSTALGSPDNDVNFKKGDELWGIFDNDAAGTLTAYVNGRQIIQTTDTTYKDRNGYVAFSSSQAGTARKWDNFKTQVFVNAPAIANGTILDDFNRASVDPMRGNWSKLQQDNNDFRIVGSGIEENYTATQGSSTGTVWNANIWGGNLQVGITVTQFQSAFSGDQMLLEIWLKMNPDGATNSAAFTGSGYRFRIDRNGTSGLTRWRIDKLVSGGWSTPVFTNIADVSSVSMAVGDKVRCHSYTNGTLVFLKNNAPVASGTDTAFHNPSGSLWIRTESDTTTNARFDDVTLDVIPPALAKNVLRGTTTIGAGSASQTQAIVPVNTSKSVLFISKSLGDASPGFGMVSGQITNSGLLTFARITAAASPATTVRWAVIEYLEGVRVQRGSTTWDGVASGMNVYLPSGITVANAYCYFTSRDAGTSYNDDDLYTVEIISTSGLLFQSRNSPANTSVVEWQVVESTIGPTFTVQTGQVILSTAQLSTTATVNSVDTSKSWLIFSHDGNVGGATDIGQKMIRGMITNSTTLTFSRHHVGGTPTSVIIKFFLITHSDATYVQHNNAFFDLADTVNTVTLQRPVPLNASLALGGGIYSQGGEVSAAGDDNPGYGGWVDMDLKTSQLTLTRAVASGIANVGWFVVTFPHDGQFSYAVADVASGLWNPSVSGLLYPMIDEIIYDDSDYIYSPYSPNNTYCEVLLSGLVDPITPSGHIVSYRFRDYPVSGQSSVTVGLYQGGSLISSYTHASVASGFQYGGFALSNAEADSITDYTNLRLRFTAN